MFSFFSARKRRIDIAPYLRRICDRTTPNSGRTEQLDRVEDRYNRALPALVWPWQNDQVVTRQCLTAITKDVTDHGMGLILNSPLTYPDLVICLLSGTIDDAQPWFFLGHVVRSEGIGAGYWLLGIEITQMLNKERPECVELLYSQAERLLPPAAHPVLA